MTPFPDWYSIGPNVRYFQQHGATGIFQEGDCKTVIPFRFVVLSASLTLEVSLFQTRAQAAT